MKKFCRFWIWSETECKTPAEYGPQYTSTTPPPTVTHSVGILRPAMGARNQVGIGLSYRPASLCSLATQFQTQFLESIPCPIAGLKFSTLSVICIYRTLGRGEGGGGQREGTVEGQRYTSIVPSSMGATVHKLGLKYKPWVNISPVYKIC